MTYGSYRIGKCVPRGACRAAPRPLPRPGRPALSSAAPPPERPAREIRPSAGGPPLNRGTGGMGTVYLCDHLLVGRKVAVKVLPTSQAANPSALGRFYREARAAGVLDHPNLVKAHDVDEDGGLHYLVMDYVDGSSLQDLVTRFGPLSVPRACHYVRLAARGLQAAHQAGLVHRDGQPATVP